MTWILTNQGREHHLQGPGCATNGAPTIEEIAHSLAQINRFTGHASRPYSVAEHSLLVADLARIEGASAIAQLAALMHDAHESITGDVSSPVKWALGEHWNDFELGQAYELHNAFGLRAAMHSHRAAIKRGDLIALATERRDLTPWERGAHSDWPILDNPLHPVHSSTSHRLYIGQRQAMEWQDWRDEFKAAYLELRAHVQLMERELMQKRNPQQEPAKP
jgi:uncharacterized protein